jgi:hypothetical protein
MLSSINCGSEPARDEVSIDFDVADSHREQARTHKGMTNAHPLARCCHLFAHDPGP